MSGRIGRPVLRRIVCVAVLVGLLVVGSSPVVTPPVRADDEEQQAKEAAARRTGVSPDSLRVGRKADARYPNAGVTAR